jgi:hypothetical protein
LDDLSTPLKAIGAATDPDLHLGVSIQSFRAKRVSDFVSSAIEGDAAAAGRHLESLARYPNVLTRSLESSRRWLREQARGTERIGLVASSNALRLKPEGINVKLKIGAEHWFLDGSQDVRSGYALEDVASEFDIQGLELDWVGVC